MKYTGKVSIFIAVAVLLFSGPPASAQFTITLPPIPKVQKSQSQQRPQPQPPEASQTVNRVAEVPEAPESTCFDATVKSHLSDLATTRAEAEEYRPGLRDYYVRDFNDNQNIYVKAALSPSHRKEWLENWSPELARCMKAPLDDLASVLRKTLPTYYPTAHQFRSPADEKILKTAVDDIARATMFKVAFKESVWKISKDNYNFPKSRYKHGIIWAKYPNPDDGFCRIIYVNLVQDYAGGGTYGESYGKFVATEFAGCPAGK